ncbi:MULTISPECIES: RidA family protein [unclassified Acinetobacter]|uniref:RidA family protein n=1 Tax=unclassified Acinetobacter TaxID=196816 RepID=UPI002362DDE4|nr:MULTISPECIES: RidA family protein [unclassified Acinetobacter]
MSVQRLHVEKRFSEVAISGQLIHLAGQLASDTRADIRSQTQQTLDIIDRLLAEAGSDKRHILSVMIFLQDIERDYQAMNEIWDRWVPEGAAPPRTCVEAKLYAPDVLVEMTVTAVVAAS